MAKISIKALKMPDLEPLIITRRECDDAAYFHEYDNCELLREVYEMSKLILKRPSCVKDYEWYVPNIFGYEYTHGYLTEVNDDQDDQIDSPKDFEEELRIHFEVQKPYQDKQLQKYWKRYKDEDIVASLLAYGIDPEKFWFALLWLKQFVDDKVRNDRVKYRDAIDCVEDFIKVVKDETQSSNEWFFNKLEMELTLRIKDKPKLKINNPAVVIMIKNLLLKHLNEVSGGENDRKLINRKLERSAEDMKENDSFFIFENVGPVRSNKNENIYLFRKYMTIYLNAHKPKKYDYITELIEDGRKGKGVSVHKDYLIYRLLRVIEYLPDITPLTQNGEPRDEKKYLKELLHNSNLEYAEEKESVTYQGFDGTEREDD